MDDTIKQESKQQQQSEISSTAEQQYRTSDLNINFLSQIYEILRCLEKETQENFVAKTGNKSTSSSSSSSSSTTQSSTQSTSEYITKLNNLRETFEQFRQQIPQVSGSNVSKEEQLQTLRSLRQQLIMKKDLLLKYKNSSFVDHLQSGISSQQQSTNN
uniref:Mediator of RNA polymerase II transcription subunit 9 n=1 Tax=Dermatophagoides pteronyssinus TaxID=6956 RepID=A0A6P6YHF0_DERPT